MSSGKEARTIAAKIASTVVSCRVNLAAVRTFRRWVWADIRCKAPRIGSGSRRLCRRVGCLSLSKAFKEFGALRVAVRATLRTETGVCTRSTKKSVILKKSPKSHMRNVLRNRILQVPCVGDVREGASKRNDRADKYAAARRFAAPAMQPAESLPGPTRLLADWRIRRAEFENRRSVELPEVPIAKLGEGHVGRLLGGHRGGAEPDGRLALL